jgi:hypothetical protein
VNSSEISLGSAPKIGRVAVRTSFMKRSCPEELARTHDSSVWLSYSAALAAVHGASTGTSFDSSSSCATTLTRSGVISGSSGALPVGRVSEKVERSPELM